MLDYISPFTFLFHDKAWWKKFALASLLTYTVIGGAPVMGWLIEVVRRVADGEDARLPEFDDWKAFWKDGAKFVSVTVLWLLPLVLVLIAVYLPLVLRTHIPDASLLILWGITFVVVLLFLLVYSVVYALFFPGMLVLLAKNEPSRRAANPVQLWKLVRANFVAYLLVFLIAGIVLFNLLFFLALLTLLLLVPPLLVYGGLVTAHFCGQLAQLESQ